MEEKHTKIVKSEEEIGVPFESVVKIDETKPPIKPGYCSQKEIPKGKLWSAIVRFE